MTSDSDSFTMFRGNRPIGVLYIYTLHCTVRTCVARNSRLELEFRPGIIATLTEM